MMGFQGLVGLSRVTWKRLQGLVEWSIANEGRNTGVW